MSSPCGWSTLLELPPSMPPEFLRNSELNDALNGSLIGKRNLHLFLEVHTATGPNHDEEIKREDEDSLNKKKKRGMFAVDHQLRALLLDVAQGLVWRCDVRLSEVCPECIDPTTYHSMLQDLLHKRKGVEHLTINALPEELHSDVHVARLEFRLSAKGGRACITICTVHCSLQESSARIAKVLVPNSNNNFPPPSEIIKTPKKSAFVSPSLIRHGAIIAAQSSSRPQDTTVTPSSGATKKLSRRESTTSSNPANDCQKSCPTLQFWSGPMCDAMHHIVLQLNHYNYHRTATDLSSPTNEGQETELPLYWKQKLEASVLCNMDLEKSLLESFVVLLNEKKKKIRELTEELEKSGQLVAHLQSLVGVPVEVKIEGSLEEGSVEIEEDIEDGERSKKSSANDKSMLAPTKEVSGRHVSRFTTTEEHRECKKRDKVRKTNVIAKKINPDGVLQKTGKSLDSSLGLHRNMMLDDDNSSEDQLDEVVGNKRTRRNSTEDLMNLGLL